jgi:hypothetical protein
MNTAQGESPAEPPVRRPDPIRPRVSGPDDDPEFLRQLDERVRRREDPPA